MIYADLINSSIVILIFVVFFWGAFVSYQEREQRAMFLMLCTPFLVSIPFLLPAVYHFNLWNEYSIVLWSLSGLIFTLIFLPIKGKVSNREIPAKRFDERDTIFSRRKLQPNRDRFNEYYADNPQKKTHDEKLQAKSGLLQIDSKYYNAFQYAAAKASFETVEQFNNFITGKPVKEKVDINPEEISLFIKEWSKKLGAVGSGITLLEDYHLYSVGGFKEEFGKSVINNHKYAIAFTVEMDKTMIDSSPKGSVVMESAEQYLNSGTVAVQVASFIRNLGYDARAHIDGNYQVICPIVASDAGLGEIGRMGILMTHKQGPRVRISVVTTDLPLVVDISKHDSSVNEFCSICKKCADSCPSGAISFDQEQEQEGIKRWRINPEACFSVWCSFGTDCGKCMSVCPYSHPDNLFHNIVRFGIKYFPNFRRLALWMDDFFYGRKPHSKKMADWMEI